MSIAAAEPDSRKGGKETYGVADGSEALPFRDGTGRLVACVIGATAETAPGTRAGDRGTKGEGSAGGGALLGSRRMAAERAFSQSATSSSESNKQQRISDLERVDSDRCRNPKKTTREGNETDGERATTVLEIYRTPSRICARVSSPQTRETVGPSSLEERGEQLVKTENMSAVLYHTSQETRRITSVDRRHRCELAAGVRHRT
jgi:hypothetical protein